MLRVISGGEECWDPINEEFVTPRKIEFNVEHSLMSIHRWESKWHKPFLETKLTKEELLDYIRCMTITQNVPEEAYTNLSSSSLNEVAKYMANPMTATKIKQSKEASNGQFVTAELVYFWMIELGIPMEWEKRHFNQLMVLIRVCSTRGTSKKMSPSEILAQNAALNAARKAKYGTKG